MAKLHLLFAVLLMTGFGLYPARIMAATSLPEDKSAAVILAYGRVGEDAYPETNIRTEQFEDHLRELLSGEYHILPLDDVVDALKAGNVLPQGSVVITFEGGYKSAYENAMPLLLQNHVPFTVFYAPDKADQGSEQFLSWSDLDFLRRHSAASFGILPAGYERLASAPQSAMRDEINRAMTKHREHFGIAPAFFSYPYGEYSAALKLLVKEHDFDAALSLNSGAASSASDPLSLPRFAMTESYSDLERFRMVSRALPFPAYDITPDAPAADLSALILPGFTVSEKLVPDLEANLSCYISGQMRPEISVIGARVELRPQSVFDERTRINCTLPGPSERWRWLGILLTHSDDAAPEDHEEAINPPRDELP